jgi:transcriptional regulator with XRE-family HTH domain
MLPGAELRRARRAADLTQEQLAARARVDRTYLSDIENDKVSPTLDMLERLCNALGVRVSAIIARVEEGQTPADDGGSDPK